MTRSVCSKKSGRTSVRPHSIATALRCWENPEGKRLQPVSLGSQRPSLPGSRGTACLAAGRDGGTCRRHHTVPRATASLELTGGKPRPLPIAARCLLALEQPEHQAAQRELQTTSEQDVCQVLHQENINILPLLAGRQPLTLLLTATSAGLLQISG